MNHLAPFRHVCGALLLGALLVTPPSAWAQQLQNQENVVPQSLLQWTQLQEANSRITACHVVWKRVQRIHPATEIAPDKWAAQTLAAARKRGLSEKEAQQEAESERREGVRTQQGRTINSTLDFVRVGNSVLCNIDYPDPDYRSRTIEFSNGLDSLYVSTQVKGRAVTRTGTLIRDPAEVLKMSAGGHQVARVLLGLPLDKAFTKNNPALSATNSSLSVLADGNMTVEREARIENKRTRNPDAITFDKKGLYPVSAESFGLAGFFKDGKATFKKHKVKDRVVASEHKKYAGDIWFPSKVVSTTPRTTTEYVLVSAKFNEEVDPAGVRLPADLSVADARFGYGPKMVHYKVENGTLPSDAEVQEQLQLRQTPVQPN